MKRTVHFNTILFPKRHELEEDTTVQGDVRFGFVAEIGSPVTLPWSLRVVVTTHRNVLNIDIRYNRLSTRR